MPVTTPYGYGAEPFGGMTSPAGYGLSLDDIAMLRSGVDPNQLYAAPEPDPRTRRDFIRPIDRRVIDYVQSMLGRPNADPGAAMQVLGSIGPSIDARFGAYQQRVDEREAAQQAALAGMPATLEQLAGLQQAGVPQEAAATAFGAAVPNGTPQQTLDTLLSQVYGGAEGGTGLPLEPESVQGVWTDAQNYAKGYVDPNTGVPVQPLPLHDARMQIMTPLRAQGYSEEALQTVYDLIGRAYSVAGGNIAGAPITTAQRMAAQAAQPEAAAPAATSLTPDEQALMSSRMESPYSNYDPYAAYR